MSQAPVKPTDSVTDASWLNWLPAIAGGLATILIGSYIFAFQKLPVTENPTAWGTFGDYMGGLLNPLISLFTLIVAMKVWGLQKTELLETRKAVEEQGKTAEQQRREQRFFDFLNLYQVTLQSVSFEERHAMTADTIMHTERTAPPPKTKSGKQAFLFLTSSGTSPIRQVRDLFQTEGFEDSGLNQLPTIYSVAVVWDKKSPLLDHYFRTVFTVLREAEPILKEDHYRYIKLFRAQLSRDEINLLAMNLLCDPEGKKMRGLVARYGMLKHLPCNKLRAIAEGELDSRSFGNKWANVSII
ncbi:MAG: hypothetical protein A3F78_19685 [Burkholderiales bacterium RIFCSPLOWO2_12_FULL_61_40]|nr:MAG: hypothetical protein A3F78_19685 [Burkholderiales bacterium RIFCSPLOWO2_12_FULL_61_40]